MIALALLLATLAPESLADQIVRCGIARDRVAVHYKPEAQADIATIEARSEALTSDHLACLVGLVLGGRLINFADPAADARFNPLLIATHRKQVELGTRQWLAERGLLEGLPVYDPAHQTLAEYGVALERHCGVAPGTMLTAVNNHHFTMVPPSFPEGEEAPDRQCIGNAAFAANPDYKAFYIVVVAPDDGLPDVKLPEEVGGGDDLPGDVERCGIARTAIEADAAPFPRVTVHGGDVTDAQLDCVAAIWMRLPRVRFSDAAVQARFLPRYDRGVQRRAVADSRAWLSRLGLLDRLPRFDPAHQSLADFGRSLERHCGARPRSVLRAHGRVLDILETERGRNSIRTIQCVMMSALASDLPGQGYVLTAGGVEISWTEING